MPGIPIDFEGFLGHGLGINPECSEWLAECRLRVAFAKRESFHL